MKNLYFLFVIVLLLVSVACNQQEKKQSENGQIPADSLQAGIGKLTDRIQRDSANPGLFQQRAMEYLAQGNFNLAMRDMLMAIELNPEEPSYMLTLSDIYMGMGLLENSMEALQKALELDPDNMESMLKIAEINLILQNYKGAIEYADKAIEQDRTNPLPDLIKGYTYAEAGDTVSAIKSYLEAVSKDQKNFDAYIQLGLIYSTAGNPLAIDYFNNALNIDPQSMEALYALAMFYQENGEAEKAISTYNRMLVIDPANVYANYNMGYVHLVLLNDYEQAITYFDKALEIKPDYHEALYNKAYCLELLGEYQAAADLYNEVLSIEVNYQKAIDGLNRIHGR